jgi:hypothetical protein
MQLKQNLGDYATYPLPVLHHSERGMAVAMRRQPLKRTYALLGTQFLPHTVIELLILPRKQM